MHNSYGEKTEFGRSYIDIFKDLTSMIWTVRHHLHIKWRIQVQVSVNSNVLPVFWKINRHELQHLQGINLPKNIWIFVTITFRQCCKQGELVDAYLSICVHFTNDRWKVQNESASFMDDSRALIDFFSHEVWSLRGLVYFIQMHEFVHEVYKSMRT